MIANERQYRITKAGLKRFEDAIVAHDEQERSPDVHPRVHRALRDSMVSEADELRAQLERYEDLRDGKITERSLDSLRDLPTALIEGRIAARLTQRALAERLGLPEQQVQRWEANRYTGASIDRLQQVADALGMRIRETIEYDSAA